MIYFIVNIHSRTGEAQKIWENLKTRLAQRNVQYKAVITEHVGHATELADQICTLAVKNGRDSAVDYGSNTAQKRNTAEYAADPVQKENASDVDDSDRATSAPIKRTTLIVVGGDGTFNEVINGMHDFDYINFGMIPVGSGNDLGRGLGISAKNPVQQLDSLLNAIAAMEKTGLKDGRIRQMDLGQVVLPNHKTHRFAISGGIGVDAEVCYRALTSPIKHFLNKLHLGSLTYLALTLQAMLTMPLVDGAVKLTHADGTTEIRKLGGILFCAAMNHRCEGGGVPMAPEADAFDGQLSLCAIHDMPRLIAFMLLPFLLFGKHEILKGVDVLNATRIEIITKQPMVVHADGEYCGEANHLGFQCLPHVLRVIL